MRPFHATMILSSRCGFGRLARTSKSFSRELASERSISASGLLEELRGLGNREALDERVLAVEFAQRVAAHRCVAVGLDAVEAVEQRGIVAEQRFNFRLRPDVEGAFAMLGLAVLEE